MVRLFVFIGLTLLCKISLSQEDSLTSSFLNAIIERTSDTSIVGYSKTIGYDYYAYVERYALKKRIWDVRKRKYLLSLSKRDRKSIQKQVLEKRNSEWGADLFNQSKLITPGQGDLYIKNYPTRDIYQFTVPIFFRKKSLALILLKRHYPGSTRGYEEIVFYERGKSGWVKLVTAERSDWGN